MAMKHILMATKLTEHRDQYLNGHYICKKALNM